MNGLAWRLLRRELRSGELRLLFAALAVAVAAVTAVGFFADRIRQGLTGQAQEMMGGDLVWIADHPPSAGQRAEAVRRGLRVAETQTFPSMVLGDGAAQLAEIKAVDGAYPLRGRLGRALRPNERGDAVAAGPAAGSVWLDERLAAALGVAPGQTVGVGRLRLPVAAILTQEPDRGVNFFSLAPRLMLNAADLPASGLVQFGSRVGYRLLVAGEARAVAGYRDWLTARLGRGERLEDAQNARPEIRSALDRAQRFLGLATLLTVVLSAVAVALAARRYHQRHLDACAVMRCLGLTQGRLLRLHAQLFAGLALLGAAVGCVLGYAAHFVLVRWLAEVFALDLPLPGPTALIHGAAAAGVLLFGFAFPPLLQLARVPTLRVLRRELGAPRPLLLGGYAVGCALLAGLILFVAGDPRLGGLAVAGFAGALAVFWLVARSAVALFARLRGGAGFGWRQGLAAFGRHATASATQIVALALGLMAVLLLTVTRGQLQEAWERAAPADAPNRFVINIQPEQRAAVAAHLAAAGIAAELAPMVRARLSAIGERPVDAASFPDDERAQRLVEREFNLSWRADLPDGNRVTAGRWFAPGDAGQGLASVEAGLAKTLGIALGDELRFAIAGREFRLKVSSLRQLEWDSMRVNFFVLAPPGVIDDQPASYITSFHLPAGRESAATALVAAFPNLTVIDIGAVLGQFQTILGQAAAGIRFIFLFTLVAGGLVLFAALLASADERRYELAVLRALGARRAQLRQALLVELALTGGLAGLLAALGAGLLGQVLARRVFDLDLALDPLVLAGSAGLAAVLTVGVGWFAVRRLLDVSPLAALRAGA
ncbi:ABC transporter permease [Azonexus sp.]|uniref:ABC transporter permease n=1 Tax=Azonexus sp. TaxID=1872668 RepID=UPI0035B295B5